MVGGTTILYQIDTGVQSSCSGFRLIEAQSHLGPQLAQFVAYCMKKSRKIGKMIVLPGKVSLAT